jgi:hypothetical protein
MRLLSEQDEIRETYVDGLGFVGVPAIKTGL